MSSAFTSISCPDLVFSRELMGWFLGGNTDFMRPNGLTAWIVLGSEKALDHTGMGKDSAEVELGKGEAQD